jgi:4-amino-4-deoxy-L-arabinose transferase-like glycosyltransferase
VFGFDSPFHLEYTRYLQKHVSLPMPHDGWEFYQPPLFYMISAFTNILFNYNIISLKLLPFACGLGTVIAIYKLTKKLFPDCTSKVTFAVLFAGSLPMNIYISAYYTNENLTSFLLNLTIMLSLIILNEEQVKLVQVLSLSFVMGFALLTKYTALPIYFIVFIFIALKLFSQKNVPYRNSIYYLFLFILIPVTISGWFYFRNYLNYGNFLASHPDFRQYFSYWQYPGFHTLNYFMVFGEVFIKPIHAGVYSFWDSLYSTLFGDGSLGGVTGRPHTFWNYKYMISTYLIAFPVLFILLIGFLKSLICAFLIKDNSKQFQHLFLVFLVCIAGIILFYKALIFGDYSSAKSFYCLFLITPLSIFFAQGMEQIYWKPLKGIMMILRTIISGWFGTFIIFIWLGFIM